MDAIKPGKTVRQKVTTPTADSLEHGPAHVVAGEEHGNADAQGTGTESLAARQQPENSFLFKNMVCYGSKFPQHPVCLLQSAVENRLCAHVCLELR